MASCLSKIVNGAYLSQVYHRGDLNENTDCGLPRIDCCDLSSGWIGTCNMLMWSTNYLYEGDILKISTLTPRKLFYLLKSFNGLHRYTRPLKCV